MLAAQLRMAARDVPAPVFMSGGIFVREGDQLVELREQPYDSESVLQSFLAQYPRLLGGDQLAAGAPRRWLLVDQEAPIPFEENGAGKC